MFNSTKLKQKREELGMKQSEVARLLDINRSSYFSWENGRAVPNKTNLKNIAEILGVTEEFFYEEEITMLYKQLNPSNQTKAMNYVKDLVDKQSNIVAMPTFPYRVYESLSAGIGATVYDNKIFDTVYFDKELAHDFASWISGDSMEPTYHSGSVALIRETGFDYDGAVYAVVWNSQTFIKKVYREKEGLRLVSINKDYKDIHIPYDENPRIVGKIVGNFMPLEV
ncbi:transcriptional regulator, putative [Streptococcus sp. HSISS2]|uniref:XRE family transcriptional regulator n=1 Tax=Streptococcus sp. HSISS2 TaxID=1316411 RepID=UPI00038AF55A|nr:transcriptional regulator, putative [Streptococcus sp. HSISS2]